MQCIQNLIDIFTLTRIPYDIILLSLLYRTAALDVSIVNGIVPYIYINYIIIFSKFCHILLFLLLFLEWDLKAEFYVSKSTALDFF